MFQSRRTVWPPSINLHHWARFSGMRPRQHVGLADMWRSFLMPDLIQRQSQKNEGVYFGLSGTTWRRRSHFSGMTVPIFSPHRESLKPEWQWCNNLCLAEGRQKLFANGEVKIKYWDIKKLCVFSLLPSFKSNSWLLYTALWKMPCS